ncbi:MAG: YbbR-like domain-containing protein [Tannerella sp.]|jgi:hypothetical protein|nr:YbbR-like domain-containing protein [Tannerella sp.]
MSRLDNSPNLFKSTIDKIKAFFRQEKWKEAMIFLFFVFLSACLWYLQSLQQEYEIEIEIPIKYKNVPADMILTENNPNTVIAKVRDKGTVLLNYSWLRTFAPIEVNMKDATPENNQTTVITRRIIESNISKQLISTTSLVSFEPQTIQVDYTELQSKELPVQLDIDITMKPGFQLVDSIKSVPDKIVVHASNAILDSLFALTTVHKEIKDVSKTQEITIRLKDIKGARMEPNQVTVIIPVEEFTEKRFILPVICTDVPDNYTLRIFQSAIEVVCNIPMSRFKDLSEDEFEIQIPFREFEENQSAGELMIRLTKKPEWISEPILNPNLIEFIIEQKNNQ